MTGQAALHDHLTTHESWLSHLSVQIGETLLQACCQIPLPNVYKCIAMDSSAKWQLGAIMLTAPHADRATLQGPVGLHNLGNTCFANTVIQCLVSLPELVNFVGDYAAILGKPSGPVSRAFGSVVHQLCTPANSAVDPDM